MSQSGATQKIAILFRVDDGYQASGVVSTVNMVTPFRRELPTGPVASGLLNQAAPRP